MLNRITTVPYLLVFLVTAGIIDAILTDLGLQFAVVEELNPWMKAAYEAGRLDFYLWKLILTIGLCAILAWFHARNFITPLIHRALLCSGALYLGILVLHAVWIINVMKEL